MTGRILSTSLGANQKAFTTFDWLLFGSVSFIWGSSFLLLAIGLDAFDPGLVTWLRVGSGAAVLLATVGCGVAVTIPAPIQQESESVPVMARMLALATLFTTPYGIVGLTRSTFAWDSLLAVLATGVVNTALALVIMGTLVGRVGSTRASFITYLIPVVALVLGVVFRSDAVAWIAIVGVSLVITGALLASRRNS